MPNHDERTAPVLSTEIEQTLDGARTDTIELGVLSDKVNQPEIDIGETSNSERSQYLEGWRLYGLIFG